MKREIRKLRESFQHAFRGLFLCICEERNFRIHMIAALYVTIFALLGGASAEQGVIFFLCFGLTMSAELMNTAIERLCDRQTTCYDSFVRNAKDIAAAAVFICAAACAGIGIFLFLGEGLLFSALAYLKNHQWILVPLAFSIPPALWYIFRYGRIQ